jgi:hypothetical protein
VKLLDSLLSRLAEMLLKGAVWELVEEVTADQAGVRLETPESGLGRALLTVSEACDADLRVEVGVGVEGDQVESLQRVQLDDRLWVRRLDQAAASLSETVHGTAYHVIGGLDGGVGDVTARAHSEVGNLVLEHPLADRLDLRAREPVVLQLLRCARMLDIHQATAHNSPTHQPMGPQLLQQAERVAPTDVDSLPRPQRGMVGFDLQVNPRASEVCGLPLSWCEGVYTVPPNTQNSAPVLAGRPRVDRQTCECP